MGSDGHTASLFPGTTALHDTTHWVVPSYVDKLASWRLTLTTPVINAAAHVLFLVQGADKAPRLAQVLGKKPKDDSATSEREALPVRHIRPHDGDTHWLLDAEAAALLENGLDY
jgi:6-phosphogluconolactonase